ncbi:MAG: hypothetical protein PHP59_04075 [Methanofollis sp.]|uniref:hypothetical protein n=1 Tax=Methanofollis sp. TaxID=2052835 RepID=UPI002607AAC9|nr:hypothetical protein [Methanofollis sp.]MDD4254535.1 hypothetical protein [Methanofollis sp.]
MKGRVIAGAIVLVFLLVIGAACICLSGVPAQTSLSAPEQKTGAHTIALMPDEEDDIPLTDDTELAAFARGEMNRLGIFQNELAGAVPGDPVFVHSLDETRHDYYLIPFETDGFISVIAQVSIKGDVADFSSAYPRSFTTQDVVRPTREEAQEVLLENGYDGNRSARLVWKFCEQTRSSTCPVWEFARDTGDTIYVGYDPFTEEIRIYDALTEKTVMG